MWAVFDTRDNDTIAVDGRLALLQEGAGSPDGHWPTGRRQASEHSRDRLDGPVRQAADRKRSHPDFDGTRLTIDDDPLDAATHRSYADLGRLSVESPREVMNEAATFLDQGLSFGA